MNKKFTVFLSSTYEDLKEERAAVIEALLKLGCIPVGMEFFSAANEDQWTQIKRFIDQCDYYVVLVAGKYGSTDETGKSYTQLEYEYALEQKVPTIGFVHRDLNTLSDSKVDSDRGKLLAFHEIIKKKMCDFWQNKDDLKSQVAISLMKLMKEHPRVGWVRADLVTEEGKNKEQLKSKHDLLQKTRDFVFWLKTYHQEITKEGRTLVSRHNSSGTMSSTFFAYDLNSYSITAFQKIEHEYQKIISAINIFEALYAPISKCFNQDELDVINKIHTERDKVYDAINKNLISFKAESSGLSDIVKNMIGLITV